MYCEFNDQEMPGRVCMLRAARARRHGAPVECLACRNGSGGGAGSGPAAQAGGGRRLSIDPAAIVKAARKAGPKPKAERPKQKKPKPKRKPGPKPGPRPRTEQWFCTECKTCKAKGEFAEADKQPRSGICRDCKAKAKARPKPEPKICCCSCYVYKSPDNFRENKRRPGKKITKCRECEAKGR